MSKKVHTFCIPGALHSYINVKVEELVHVYRPSFHIHNYSFLNRMPVYAAVDKLAQAIFDSFPAGFRRFCARHLDRSSQSYLQVYCVN